MSHTHHIPKGKLMNKKCKGKNHKEPMLCPLEWKYVSKEDKWVMESEIAMTCLKSKGKMVGKLNKIKFFILP